MIPTITPIKSIIDENLGYIALLKNIALNLLYFFIFFLKHENLTKYIIRNNYNHL